MFWLIFTFLVFAYLFIVTVRLWAFSEFVTDEIIEEYFPDATMRNMFFPFLYDIFLNLKTWDIYDRFESMKTWKENGH